MANKNTELFSKQDPDTIFAALISCAEKQGINYQESKDKYKIKLNFQLPDDSEVQVLTRILRVNEDTVCVEFTKTKGDVMKYYEQFNSIKKYFGCVLEEEC